ncbi:MAG: tetratricopeptide repeat protein [Niabella sp.]
MREFSQYSDEREDINELLEKFDNLRKGKTACYLNEDAFETIIEYFETSENFIKAKIAVDMAIEQYPYSGSLRVKKADILLTQKKYEEALELLEHAAILDSNNIDIYILKTETFLALDRHDDAVELLEQALMLFEGDDRIDLLFELSDVYDDYEDFEKVFDCLKAILMQEPANEEALYKICFWTDFTGRNAESIELHLKIIDENPYSELAWFNLGAAYQGIKLYEKAIDAYKYAIAIDEKFDFAYRNMGDAYIRLRKYKDAIENLEKVLEFSKPEDVLYEAIGYCYEKQKNFAQARFYYRKASHLNLENSYMFYKIAFTYYRENKFEQCAKQLETALKIKRNKPEYNLLMGECKMLQGYVKEAIQYLMTVVQLRPKSVIGWEALVKGLYETEQYDDALQQIENAGRFIGEKAVLKYYKTAIYFALGSMKEALLHLEDALTTSPTQLKKLIQMNPSLLQYQQVTDLIVKYKRKRKSK